MADVQVDTLGTFVSSLFQVLQWPTFGFMLIGMFIGFWVGILPGIGGGTTLALMLPFVFTMDPVTAFVFLLGMRAVTNTTGDITSVLFGVPGEGTSAATVFDGYPMTKNGQAGRALGIVLFSSLVGAVFGALFLALSVPFVRPIVLSFGPPEFFMLAVLGLSFVASLSGVSIVKGLMMGGFGMLLATVGQDPGTARLRFTFGEPYLFDGINLVPVAIGLLAVPSIIEMMATKTSIARSGVHDVSGSFEGVKDNLRHWWLNIRCGVIGVFIGVVPGIGGGAAQFVAYAHALQTSRHKEEFGRGSPEGLIAAGSVNNSKEGGDLLPTLAFGIPGSAGMAILLGAFLITGITPGPAMLTTNLHVTFAMVWTIVVANIIVVAFCFLFIRQLAWITFVKGSILVPYLVFLIAVGSYTANNAWGDIIMMMIFGAAGWVAAQWRWPVAPLLLGLVLGDMTERNYFLSYSLYGFSWLGRPLVVGIAIVTILGLAWPLIQERLDRRAAGRRPAVAPPQEVQVAAG